MPAERPRPTLSHSRLFTGMPEAHREALLAASAHRSLRKGQVLLRQGEPASAFYLIESGYLKLTQVTADGSEVIVRFVGPGDPVGGVAALGEAPYPVSATAVDACEVRSWPRANLSSL